MSSHRPTTIARHALAATLAIAAVAIVSAPVVARAAPVTVEFSLSSTTGSSAFYAPGTPGSGSFRFDDTLMPASGSGLVGNAVTGLPTLGLNFSWFGASFDAVNASIATLRYTDGQLTDWSLGGRYTPPICGLLRYGCLHSAGTEADFMLSASGGGSLNDGVHAGIGAGYGTLRWSLQAAPVPEASTWALAGLGLLGIGLRRRLQGHRDRRAAAPAR